MNDFNFASWLVGFIDGEGCFSISFSRNRRLTLGIEVRPSFSVSQNSRSVEILRQINEYFQCGSIRESRGDNTYKYEVRSITELRTIIIPFFKEYPLLTSKLNDFLLFEQVCLIISKEDHTTIKGLKEIIQLVAQMNPSGKRRIPLKSLLEFLESKS